MPEGQTTDGQTEWQCQCQGLEEAVAELDNIVRKHSKTIRSSDVNCGRAVPGERRLLGQHRLCLMERHVLAYFMSRYCLFLGLGGWGHLHSTWERGASLED